MRVRRQERKGGRGQRQERSMDKTTGGVGGPVMRQSSARFCLAIDVDAAAAAAALERKSSSAFASFPICCCTAAGDDVLLPKSLCVSLALIADCALLLYTAAARLSACKRPFHREKFICILPVPVTVAPFLPRDAGACVGARCLPVFVCMRFSPSKHAGHEGCL